MAVGEKVSDLFHLERAFERDRVIKLPSEKKHPANIDIFLRDRLNLVAQLQDFLNLTRQCFERVDHSFSFCGRKLAHSAEEKTDQG